MMHYRKGENIEEEIKKEDLPFEDCLPKGQENFLWMRVKGGTKVHNVVSYAKNALDKGEYRTIVWTGVGGGVVKTVSCAEIIKRTHPLFQVTRMCYSVIEEHWIPQLEGLDEIVAKRQIPCLHILMSLDEIDDNVAGLQKPNTTSEYMNRVKAPTRSNNRGRGNRAELRRNEHLQQSLEGSRGQRQQGGPKPQTSSQQSQSETPERPNQQNEKHTPKSGENSGTKRKRNNRKPKPRDNANTSQTSFEQPKSSKPPQKSTGEQPMDT